MSLAPEQRRALRYLERKGTAAAAKDVHTSLARGLGALEAMVAGIDAATARRRPRNEGWSVHQVVDHLVLSHEPAIVQLQRALRGDDPGAAIPAGITSDDPFALAWDDQRAALAGVHRGLLDAVADGADEPTGEASRASRIPVVLVIKGRAADGSATTYEWVEELDWKAYAIAIRAHSLEHVAHIQRILDADHEP